ncbi:MAG: trimeric intracellular cation channel family protein [Bacteroidota bacterium]
MFFTFHNTIELLGIVAFGVSGALSAMQKRLDIFGVLVITFITAIGGGTLRDMLIGSLPVAWILDLQAITTLLIAYLLALFFNKYIRLYTHLLFWLDTAGLALFCVVAIDKGIAFQLHPMVCVALGTITGCFGGIFRDVVLNEIPYVFRKDVYASACIAGGIVFFGLMQFIDDRNLISILSGVVIAVIRIGAKYFGLHMPDIYGGKKMRNSE